MSSVTTLIPYCWSPGKKWIIPNFQFGKQVFSVPSKGLCEFTPPFSGSAQQQVCQEGTCSLASEQGQAVHHPALKHSSVFLVQTGVGPGAYQKASPVCHCLHLTPAISQGLNMVTRTGCFISVAFSEQLCLPWDRCTVSGWAVAIRKQSWCYFLLFLCYCYPFHRICIACSLGWHFNNR